MPLEGKIRGHGMQPGGGRQHRLVQRVGIRRAPAHAVAEPGRGAPLVQGATLLALAERRFAAGETAAEAKRLMREVLDHYLEQRGIESRRMVQDLQALVGERSDKA